MEKRWKQTIVRAALVLAASSALSACTLDTWRLTEGPHAGVDLIEVVSFTLPGGNQVIPACNPATNATGGIHQDQNCCLTGQPPCPNAIDQAPHYHGTLFGQPDPNPTGCGWGRTEFVSEDPLGTCTERAAGERVALGLMAKNPPDYENALVAVRESLDLLGVLAGKVDDPSQLPRPIAHQLQAELRTAIRHNQQAQEALARLLEQPRHLEDEAAVVSNLESAWRAKERAVRILVEPRTPRVP